MTEPKASPSPKAADTRQRLIRAGTELMWEFGYADVSVGDILKKAGALKGSFYHFFPSKQDFLIACLREYWRDMSAELQAIYGGLPADQAIEAHMRWFVDLQQQNLSRYGRVLGGFHQSIGSEHHHNPAVAAVGQELARAHEAMIGQALETLSCAGELWDPATLLKVINYCIDGALFRGRAENSLQPVSELPVLVSRMLRAARRAPQRPAGVH